MGRGPNLRQLGYPKPGGKPGDKPGGKPGDKLGGSKKVSRDVRRSRKAAANLTSRYAQTSEWLQKLFMSTPTPEVRGAALWEIIAKAAPKEEDFVIIDSKGNYALKDPELIRRNHFPLVIRPPPGWDVCGTSTGPADTAAATTPGTSTGPVDAAAAREPSQPGYLVLAFGAGISRELGSQLTEGVTEAYNDPTDTPVEAREVGGGAAEAEGSAEGSADVDGAAAVDDEEEATFDNLPHPGTWCKILATVSSILGGMPDRFLRQHDGATRGYTRNIAQRFSRQKGQLSDGHAPRLYHGTAIAPSLGQSETLHIDRNDPRTYTIILVANDGKPWNSDKRQGWLVLPQLNIEIELLPGTVVMFQSSRLAHYIRALDRKDAGKRVAVTVFTWKDAGCEEQKAK